MNIRQNRGRFRKMIHIAREFRKTPTQAERLLWNSLRNRKLGGYKFRRQHSIDYYIVDFCCPEIKLVIEADGDIHLEQEGSDLARTEHLEAVGFQVLRFKNQQIIENHSLVLESILQAATARN